MAFTYRRWQLIAHCSRKPANFYCRYKRLMALRQDKLGVYILRLIHSLMETTMEECSTPTSRIPPYLFPSLARMTSWREFHDELSTTGNAARQTTIIMVDSADKNERWYQYVHFSSQPERQLPLPSQLLSKTTPAVPTSLAEPKQTAVPTSRAEPTAYQSTRRCNNFPCQAEHLPKNTMMYKSFGSYFLIYIYTRLTQGQRAA